MKANQTTRRRKTPSKESSDRPDPRAASSRGRPKRLKVLNLTFTVLFMNDAQMAGTGAVGFCDPETQTIGLVGSQSNDSMQDTFLHEVFHSIVHVMDLKETETEENYVPRLATGLCAVWNNNPAASSGGVGWFSRLPIC